MNEEELVNSMLAMGAGSTPSPENTDPVATATNTASQEAEVPNAAEGAPTETTQAENTGTQAEGKTEGPTSPVQAPIPPKEDKPVDLEETFEKSNKAFAEQRLELKKYKELAQRFASMANMPAQSADEAYSGLAGILTQQEAKAKNLDPIILKTLQEQESKLARYEQEEIKKEANASFQELQKTFNLDAKEITSFAKQLSAEGVNPFATRGINLSQYYLAMNHQKLIERAREQGRKEESERQKRVTQSTTPGQSVGQTPPAAGKEVPQTTGTGIDDFKKLLGIK